MADRVVERATPAARRRHRPARARRRSRPARGHRLDRHLHHHGAGAGPAAGEAARRGPRARRRPAAQRGGAAAARRGGRRRRRGAAARRSATTRSARSARRSTSCSETAVQVAVEQAELRRSVRDVFLNLARRSQALVHRQLALLDAMERAGPTRRARGPVPDRPPGDPHAPQRREPDRAVRRRRPAGLAQPGPADRRGPRRGRRGRGLHPGHRRADRAGRARRPGRRRRHPPARRAGRERGLLLAAAHRRCRSRGQRGRQRVRRRDRGPRPGHERRRTSARPTSELANPPEFKLSSTARLGLYVVGRLAERHGIRVPLRESPYGGTTAIVLLPSTLMAEEPGRRPFGGASTRRPGQRHILRTARHRGWPAPQRPGPRDRQTPTPRRGEDQRTVSSQDRPEPDQSPTVDLVTSASPEPVMRRSEPEILDARPACPGGRESVVCRPDRPRRPWPRRHRSPRRRPGDIPTPAPTAAQIGRAGRGPDEIRNIMSSYRSGTLRGRTDAARLAESAPPCS